MLKWKNLCELCKITLEMFGYNLAVNSVHSSVLSIYLLTLFPSVSGNRTDYNDDDFGFVKGREIQTENFHVDPFFPKMNLVKLVSHDHYMEEAI